jgi:hypothetical protein
MQPLLNAARIDIAPVRYGAGTKGKVVQAMALGLPSVGNSIAFEGMGVDDGITARIADSPDELCKTVVDLCNSEEECLYVSSNGFMLADKFFVIDAM